MTETQWKRKIKQQMEAAGTYKDFFRPAIDTLARILEERDLAFEDYVRSGREATIIKTSDRGAENLTKNPKLQIWMELNRDALTYWRDMGLTAAGLKKLDDAAMKNAEKKVSSLEEALVKLSGGKES